MGRLKTLIDFLQMNKVNFDNNYNLMLSSYEQNNFVLYTYLYESADIPVTVKTTIEEWLQGYSKGCEDLKQIYDQGYSMVEKSMSSVEK